MLTDHGPDGSTSADRHACRACAVLAVLSRYAGIVEQRRFGDLDAVFAPDAMLLIGERAIRGLEAIRAMIEALPPPRAHLFGNAELTRLDEAEAVMRATGIVFRAGGDIGVLRLSDRLILLPEGWRVAQRRIEPA